MQGTLNTMTISHKVALCGFFTLFFKKNRSVFEYLFSSKWPSISILKQCITKAMILVVINIGLMIFNASLSKLLSSNNG